VRAVPRRDADGHVVAWIATSTEIDRRARAERALRMLAEVSRRLGAGLDDADELGRIVREALPVIGDAAMLELGEPNDERRRISASADPSHASLLEDPRFEIGPATVAYSGRPLVHANVARELDEARSDRAGDGLRFLAELGVAAHMCLPLASRGRTIGTLTAVRLRKDAYYTDDDVEVAEDLARRIAVAVDNARLQEQTEKRRLELEEANRGKDVFLATLSHELRTPLNAIVGWTDMMRSGQVTGAEQARAIDAVDRNAHALSNLVADLLDVSRIVTGTLKLDTKLVGLAAVVEAAIEAARPACATKRVALEVSIGRVGCVDGDAGRLKQVFGNLLSNAIKFTPAGGRIVVTGTRENGRGGIVVKDEGEGIAPELLPHVFERFKQAEKARAKGLGLGLAIVKHLVEAHGGTVTAASEGLGKGATFAVELPIAAEEGAQAADEARSKEPASGPPELAGVYALVVEDDPDGNELITTILERYGARVTSVATAAAALEALDAERPDVLVSDIGLPDADGIELIKSVRARSALEGLPAIALTAYASRQDATKAVAAGFDSHVAKPVQPATLGEAVARLLARRPAPLKSQPAA
jgi:signal transduction histidine kinase/CheY-like chemotaxis protein